MLRRFSAVNMAKFFGKRCIVLAHENLESCRDCGAEQWGSSEKLPKSGRLNPGPCITKTHNKPFLAVMAITHRKKYATIKFRATAGTSTS